MFVEKVVVDNNALKLGKCDENVTFYGYSFCGYPFWSSSIGPHNPGEASSPKARTSMTPRRVKKPLERNCRLIFHVPR